MTHELGAIIFMDNRLHHYIATRRSDGQLVTVTRDEGTVTIYVGGEPVPESPSMWTKTPIDRAQYCQEQGCRQPIKARRRCAAHYKRWLRQTTGRH